VRLAQPRAAEDTDGAARGLRLLFP
jgi:hypothetical protein